MALIYVNNVTGDDGDTGLTEALAKASIQGAIDASSSGDTIFIVNTGTTYRGPVKITSKNRLKFTSTPGNPATISPSRNDSTQWSVLSGSVYSYAVPAGYVLDSDPLTVYEGTTKLKRSSSAPASLAAGEYTFSSGILYCRTSGSVDPDTIPVKVPVQKTASTPTRMFEVSGTCTGIIIENLNIIECGKYALYLTSSCANWILRNLTINYCIQNPILIESNGTKVLNCTISNNGTPVTSNTANTITDVEESGILLNNTSNCIIRNNKVDTFVRSGIKIISTTDNGNNVILENEIKSQIGCVGGGGLDASQKLLASTKYDYWRGNVVYNCNENAIIVKGSRNNIFANNTLAYNSRGIYLVKYDSTLPSENNIFVNNINSYLDYFNSIWLTKDFSNLGLRGCEIHIDYETSDSSTLKAAMKNNMFRNNLYYRGVPDPFFALGKTIYNYDTWIESAGIDTPGHGDFDSLVSNPNFKNGSTNLPGTMASVVKDDFRPSLGSPVTNEGFSLINFGEYGSDAWTYFSKNLVRDDIDIGAFDVESMCIDPEQDLLLKFTIPLNEAGAQDQTTLYESNATTSYGGLLGYVEFTGAGLFPVVDSSEIIDEVVRYRAIDCKNVAIKPSFVDSHSGNTPTTNIHSDEGDLLPIGAETGVRAYIYLQAEPGTEVNVQWEEGPSSGYQAAQADDVTDPSITPSFTATPPDSDAPVFRTGTTTILGTSTSADGENARLWLKRSTTEDAVYRKEEKVILRIQGKASSG